MRRSGMSGPSGWEPSEKTEDLLALLETLAPGVYRAAVELG